MTVTEVKCTVEQKTASDLGNTTLANEATLESKCSDMSFVHAKHHFARQEPSGLNERS